MRCARHPNIETNLNCSKCGQPICPQCLVQTPVGARCPTCANIKRPVIYQVPASYYLKAVAVGLVVALLCGVVWALIPLGGFFLFLLAAGVGYIIGEVVSFATNRKRGVRLQVVAAGCVLVSYITRGFLFGASLSVFVSVFGLIALAIGIFVAVSQLR